MQALAKDNMGTQEKLIRIHAHVIKSLGVQENLARCNKQYISLRWRYHGLPGLLSDRDWHEKSLVLTVNGKHPKIYDRFTCASEALSTPGPGMADAVTDDFSPSAFRGVVAKLQLAQDMVDDIRALLVKADLSLTRLENEALAMDGLAQLRDPVEEDPQVIGAANALVQGSKDDSELRRK